MSEDRLWSLYGEVGNKRVVPIRSICRERLTGMDNFLIQENLDRSSDEAREVAKEIRMLNGSDHAADKAQDIADVLDYWYERPGELRQLIRSKYDYMIQNAGNDTASAEYESDEKCPYEQSPNKQACWGCKLPIEVWQSMERQYNNAAERAEGMKEGTNA